jgi:hypothetical protein
VWRRVGDKRLLALAKAVLTAGIMTQSGRREETITGTPQGGILSPLLANIALSALDEHFARKWEALGIVSQELAPRLAVTSRCLRQPGDRVHDADVHSAAALAPAGANDDR